VVLGGLFGGTLDFGYGPMMGTGQTYDGFVAKLRP
jgi:hypothetical protein